MGWCKCSKNVKKKNPCVCFTCFSVTADTFLVEGNKQEHQLSNLKPSTTYSVGLYATKGPLTSGTVITNLQTRMYSFYSAGFSTVGSAVSQCLTLSPHSRRHRKAALEPVCVEFKCVHRVCVDFLWVLQFHSLRRTCMLDIKISPSCAVDQGHWVVATRCFLICSNEDKEFLPGD